MVQRGALRTSKVHNKQVDDELRNLEGCKVFLPLHGLSAALKTGTASCHIPRFWRHLQSHSSSSLHDDNHISTRCTDVYNLLTHDDMDHQVDGNRDPLLQWEVSSIRGLRVVRCYSQH